jgi:hypothetical protein
MSMDRKTINEAIKHAREFNIAALAALERLDAEIEQRDDRYDELGLRGFDGARPAPGPSPHDYSYGSKETGALRRKSMDLTRKLAELRKHS